MINRASNLLLGCAAVVACAVGACSSPRLDPRAAIAADHGRYGPAAAELQKQLTEDTSDRQYLLGRMGVLQMTLAEGIPDAGEEVANQLFALLRTQGLNADKTVSSVVFNEGVKVWKGEPFEQALAYHTIAMQKAMRGEWDNARAAASSSLFLLKDFSEAVGKDASPTELAREAAERDKSGSEQSGDELLNTGYAVGGTDFALGYLMTGIASKALSRDQEANDNFAAAAEVDSSLEPLARMLRDGRYNTVLVVDYGMGPSKRAEGRDGAISVWRPRTPSGGERILASVDQSASAEFPPVQDVNAMAHSHRWNNLEDVRALKSGLGDVLVAGGLITASSARNNDTAWAGLGVALLGAVMKGNAKADTRHAELLPQRVYLVPLMVPGEGCSVMLEVAGDPASRVTLNGVSAPQRERVQLRYVRIPPIPGPWLCAGTIVYANDAWRGTVPGDDLPYIFGGMDVSRPSPRAMERYRTAGNLSALTQVDLENLYREEGITWTVEDQGGAMRRHILDGGDSLIPPLPGTVGYQRLFGQPHDPYRPRSDALKHAIEAELSRKSGS